jgi:hypothetical protein
LREQSENSDWFRTDQHRELVDAAEFTVEQTARLPSTPAWRWVIVGSVLSFQGACVCGLSGEDTSGTNILKKHQRAKYLEWLNNPAGPEPPKDLPGPMALLLRVCDAAELPSPNTVTCTEAERSDVEKLVNFRNQFAHFLPQGWSLEVTGLPRMITACWGIIYQLCIERPTFLHRVEPPWRERMAACAEYMRHKMIALGVDA